MDKQASGVPDSAIAQDLLGSADRLVRIPGPQNEWPTDSAGHYRGLGPACLVLRFSLARFASPALLV